MKYKPSRDLPEFAREAKTLSPSKLSEMILNRRNEKVTPESVTMWFKRHSDVYEQLSKLLVQGLPGETETVDTTIYQEAHFRELQSVKNWILEMNARELASDYIEQRVDMLKSCCQGSFPKWHQDFVKDQKWCLKHPDRLTLNDAIEIVSLIKTSGNDAYHAKGALKDFLISKGVVIGKKIAVGRSKSYGKYAKLFVEMPKLQAMLLELRTVNFEACVVDEFMFETATRKTATLNAQIENMVSIGNHAMITVFDKGRRSKYAEGHPWDKRISAALLKDIKVLIGERKRGKIFSIEKSKLGDLNRAVILKYAPEVFERYPNLAPNHFWRHMFAQHMLRATDWNYAPVAALGGWTPQALEESYGKPPDETVKQWADKYTLSIEVVAA